MRKLIFIIFLILLVGCNPAKESKLVSGILIEHMDASVNPGDDFYNYINGSWVKNAVIPPDKSSYGIVSIIREEAEEDVRSIIEESSSGEFEEGSDEQKVGDLYHSYMAMDKRNEIGIVPLQAEFDKIDAISDYEGLSTYFAYADKYGYTAPLGLYINTDYKDPTVYTVYVWQTGLGLPDREYYLKDDPRSREIQASYVAHIEKMFDLAQLQGGNKAAASIMALETKLAEKHLEKEKTRDPVKLYNMLEVSALQEMMPNFNWTGFLNETGIENQEKLAVMMIEYTTALNDIIAATDLDTWKVYLKWGVLNNCAGRLNEVLDQEDFAFYGRELTGAEEQRPLWRRGTTIVNQYLGEVVGKVYVKKHFPPEAKERMESLVENLLNAYEVSIKQLDWMSDETKEQALDKLSKFTPKIGYPSKWKDYSSLTIDANDLFGNIRSARLYEHNRIIAKLGQPIDREEWGMTPQTVNAYYNPTMNEIVFPAAILQPPFFNMEADDAVNFGAIGAIIGHEVGHGFDDQGSNFDGDGMMRNWWTDVDREEFKERTSALITQYNEFEALPGLNVNGEFTLGENIGDLGGLNIAIKAYSLSLNGKEGPVMDGFTAEQRVFIGWAQAYLGKIREDALRLQVNTDPHSPGKFRVNGVVRNIPEFYTAFNIQEQDSLFLETNRRVKIW
jgi:putative endopeptidase